LFVFNPFPGFDCIFTALNSRTVAHKTRTKFLLKFVRDISTKMTLSFLRASLSVRDLSTNSSANSGNSVQYLDPRAHFPAFEYSVTSIVRCLTGPHVAPLAIIFQPLLPSYQCCTGPVNLLPAFSWITQNEFTSDLPLASARALNAHLVEQLRRLGRIFPAVRPASAQSVSYR